MQKKPKDQAVRGIIIGETSIPIEKIGGEALRDALRPTDGILRRIEQNVTQAMAELAETEVRRRRGELVSIEEVQQRFEARASKVLHKLKTYSGRQPMETLFLAGLFLFITSAVYFTLIRVDYWRRRRQVLARLEKVVKEADAGGSREAWLRFPRPL